ncbi:MAG: TolC family protein [Deltaproteobacteria bacterium]|nr:TolC family protein [Deltaproteobacteria bacterium]
MNRPLPIKPIFVSWLLVVPLLAGCAVFQPTPADSPSMLPGRLAVHDNGRSHGVRADLPSGPLTIKQALAIAITNNPDIVASKWDIEAARAHKRYESSGYWPSLSINAAYRHNWHEERLVPARNQGLDATFTHDIFAGDLVLSIPLISGGRVMSAVAEADLMARASACRLARTKEELIFNVKSTFYSILGQIKMLEALEHSRMALDEHLQMTEALVAARKAAKVDLLNIEVRLAELNHRMVKQQGMVEISKRFLASLLGIEAIPEDGVMIEGKLSAGQKTPDSGQILSTVIETRQDMAEFVLQIQAQAKRVDIARAAYWPILSAKGTYGGRASAQGDYDDLGFAGIDLALPFFNGLSTIARVEEEQAKLQALRERKRKLALGIRREVESALIQMRTATSQVNATEKAIAKAEESLRIAREMTALGHGTAMDVLDAQAALLNAETRYFGALVDLHTSIALLNFTTGTTT